eukprot:6138472-Heterocapsa_arctica.AAC.1
MITTMLIINSLVTPVLSGIMIDSPIWSGLFTFFLILALWSANYVAVEIESPFGDDANDLP